MHTPLLLTPPANIPASRLQGTIGQVTHQPRARTLREKEGGLIGSGQGKAEKRMWGQQVTTGDQQVMQVEDSISWGRGEQVRECGP